MVTAFSRLRALLALVLFATSDGGAQFLDAVVFHSRPEPVQESRVNAGDRCHAERCDLGIPITSPPLVARPTLVARLEAAPREVAALRPDDVPCTAIPAAPVGSRAPPRHS